MSAPATSRPRIGTGGFTWAVGIEDTFIGQPHARTGRVLDEYEITGHYGRWRDDLWRAADLGIDAIRWGIPWYRVNPADGAWDWRWTDEVFEELVLRLGVRPIVDLVHYGCPLWLDGTFVAPDYPARVAEYAGRVAERYRDLLDTYTPLNEPVVNAAFCGRDGTWPPYLRGARGYVQVVLALARGMVATVAAIRAARADVTIVQVEAVEWVSRGSEGVPVAEVEAERARALSRHFLPTDLLLGLVDRAHPLHDRLVALGATEAQLEDIRVRAQEIDVMGVNFYPHLSVTHLAGGIDGPLRGRRDYGTGDDLAGALAAFAARYRVPVMVTETSNNAGVARRTRWMDQSLAAIARVSAAGVQVAGYTWFPAFSLADWRWRRGTLPVDRYWCHMGLWDLACDGSLERRETPLVGRYAMAVAAGPPGGSVPTPASRSADGRVPGPDGGRDRRTGPARAAGALATTEAARNRRFERNTVDN